MKKNQCVVCFKSLLDEETISSLFEVNNCICKECLNKFEIINKKEIIHGVEIWFLYHYNDFLKSLIYQYKGCYDIALKDAFLRNYRQIIKRKYKGYTIISPPSNKDDDIKRGFLHMEEIAKTLNMKYERLFYKKENYKQSEHHFTQRAKIKDIIDVIKTKKIEDKKYLIIDDIYTSGSTIKALISILEKHKVNKNNIKALIIGKVK